jgi:hypothetical protein
MTFVTNTSKSKKPMEESTDGAREDEHREPDEMVRRFLEHILAFSFNLTTTGQICILSHFDSKQALR